MAFEKCSKGASGSAIKGRKRNQSQTTSSQRTPEGALAFMTRAMEPKMSFSLENSYSEIYSSLMKKLQKQMELRVKRI